MSYQWQTLKDQIDAMTPSGNTNQAVGLAWGWQSLSTTNGPIAAPAKDTNYIYKDYIVLLSDGLNTQNRWYTNASDIDARQELLCENIKDRQERPTRSRSSRFRSTSAARIRHRRCCKIAPANGNFQMITQSNQTSRRIQEHPHADLQAARREIIAYRLDKKKARPLRPGFFI